MNCIQRIIYAQNTTTPQETLELLATDEDWFVRRYVARNPNTPQETLELLATDKDSIVRYCVARNPNRTEIIERLVLMANHKLAQAADPTP